MFSLAAMPESVSTNCLDWTSVYTRTSFD